MCDGFGAIIAGVGRKKSPMDLWGRSSINRWLARQASPGGSALVIGPHWKGGDDRFGVREAGPGGMGALVVAGPNWLPFAWQGRGTRDFRIPGARDSLGEPCLGPAPVARSGKTRDASRCCCPHGPRPMAAARIFSVGPGFPAWLMHRAHRPGWKAWPHGEFFPSTTV
jgi:hypothetical protein